MREPALARLGLGQADMGELGIGEGHPRDDVLVHLHGQAKQRVPDDEAGMIVGEVGELPPARDVADGIDAPVGGLEPLVDDDPAAVVCDAGLLEAETVGVRAAAGRDQEMAALDRLLAVAVAHHDLDPRVRRARRARPSTPLRRSTPSRASASSTTPAHSASSRASGCAASSTVTAAPSRRKACASSRPIGPAPMTMRCSGRVVRSNTVSLVR